MVIDFYFLKFSINQTEYISEFAKLERNRMITTPNLLKHVSTQPNDIIINMLKSRVFSLNVKSKRDNLKKITYYPYL